jgi:dolichol-phosphate mannosyltransferase
MISLIIPTYNEKEVISDLVEKIFDIFNKNDIDGELIIVDDNSPDGTGDIADKLSEKYKLKVVHRKGKLGLSSAVIEGLKVARGEIIGVMDADFSHDPEIIPQMIKNIQNGSYELAVGSRYVKGGGIENWPLTRRIISRLAIMFAIPITPIKDITSGYFFVKKDCIDGVKINAIGFKIGLELFVKANYKKFIEVPYIFKDRRAGISKMNSSEVKNYLKQLADLYAYKFLKR